MHNIKKLMNVLQNGFYNKQFFVYFKYSLSASLFLNFLWKNNIILGYITNNENLKIFLQTSFKKFLYCFFKTVLTTKSKIVLNLEQINNLKKTKFYIFKTSLGFLTIYECQRHQVGGTLLFVLQY